MRVSAYSTVHILTVSIQARTATQFDGTRGQFAVKPGRHCWKLFSMTSMQLIQVYELLCYM